MASRCFECASGQALSEYAYDAEIANCSYNLDIGDNGIILTLPGCSEEL